MFESRKDKTLDEKAEMLIIILVGRSSGPARA